MSTPIGIILGVVVLLVFLSVAAAVLFRLVVVRPNSTPVVFRRTGQSVWRYGAVRYSDTEIAFYRLLSLRFGADTRLARRTLVMGTRREATGAELDVVEAGEKIVGFSGRDRDGRVVEGELCLGPAEMTALLSWVEACSTDQIRRPARRRR